MEVRVKIGGSATALKCTAGTLFLYREFFGKEFISEMGEKDDINANFKFMWACAKTADPSFMPPEIWAEQVARHDLTVPITTAMKLLERSIKIDDDIETEEDGTSAEAEWSSAKMIAQGLMVGLSYADMREMSVGLLISVLKKFCGIRTGGDEPKSRKATQEDFDKF